MTDLVVPWRATPDRIPLWRHLRARWEAAGFRITLGSCQGPWVKAAAVADGIARTSADVLVIADADVWCDSITEAVVAVERGAKWAVPHARILRLDADSTVAVLAGTWPPPRGLEVPPHPAVPGGGIAVIRRSLYEACPMPPLARREDEMWGAALTRIARPWRGIADLFHLHHERGSDG